MEAKYFGFVLSVILGQHNIDSLNHIGAVMQKGIILECINFSLQYNTPVLLDGAEYFNWLF